MAQFDAYKQFMYALEGAMEEIVSGENTDPRYLQNIDLILDEFRACKVFEISEDIKRLLLLTNVPPELEDKLIRLPYPSIFLDVCLSEEDGYSRELKGILAWQLTENETKEFEKLSGGETAERMTKFLGVELLQHAAITTLEKYPQGLVFFPWFIISKDVIKRPDERILRNLILNLSLFLMQPDVRTIEMIRGAKSQDRAARKGHNPLPNSVRIIVAGETKKYLDKLNSQGHLSHGFSHKFWVRGHWRKLESAYYTLKKGQYVWIAPHIKGEGMLVEKTYKIDSSRVV